MRATVMHEAGDVRIENRPDVPIKLLTDALIRVTRACICGSDLWPYNDIDLCKLSEALISSPEEMRQYLDQEKAARRQIGS